MKPLKSTCFLLSLFALSVFGGLAQAAKSAAAPAAVRHEIPFGADLGGLVPSGTTIAAMLCLQSRVQSCQKIEFEFTVPPPFKPLLKGSGIKAEQTSKGWVLRQRVSLGVSGEKWFTTIQIEIPPKTPPGGYQFLSSLSFAGQSAELPQADEIQVVSGKELSNLFKISPLSVPVNEMGESDARQEPDTVLIKSHALNIFQRLVVPDDPDKAGRGDPATFAAVTLESRADHPAALMVRLDLLDPVSGKTAPGFEIPYAEEHGMYAGGSGVYQIVSIKPQEKQTAILPLYTNETQVLPGKYTARVQVSLFGSDLKFHQSKSSLEVTARQTGPALSVMISLLTACGGLIFFIVKRRRFFNLPVRTLILISFFATVTFAMVNIPGTLLLHAAHVILGPFSFLITGFFYEVVFYILITALLVLVPHFGAVSLVIAVRFLMSAFILGDFSPLALLYYPTMAVVLEAAAFFSGLTRSAKLPQPLRCALFLAVADALLSLMFFNLNMFFYRLYYAGWYIGAYVIINGFGFTSLAVPFGFRLGIRLKGVSHV